MRHLLITLLIVIVVNVSAFAQDGEGIDPQRGLPGTEVVITKDSDGRNCWLHSENSANSDQIPLTPTEIIDDFTFVTLIPSNVELNKTYYVFCGGADREFRRFIGTFTTNSGNQTGTTTLLQPENYFNSVTMSPARSTLGALRRIGSDWVIDVEFENPSLQQLNLRVRGANQNTVQTYANYVASHDVHFESFINSTSFALNADLATNQTPVYLSNQADISVDLTILSAGTRAQGLANYVTYFRIDPPIESGSNHDYLVTNQQFAAARATSTGATVRLTMWLTEPSRPRYANSDTTQGDGQTIFLKNGLQDDNTGNYAARVSNEGFVASEYTLDGTFGEMICPPRDPGCPPLPPLPVSVVYARVEQSDMSCDDRRGLLNVRTGPGVEYGIVSRLMVCDPVAIVGRAQASDGGRWVRLYSDDPRWINVRFTDFDSDYDLIPLSTSWSTNSTFPEIKVGDSVAGYIGDEYGATHFFNSSSNSYIVSISADASGTIDVVLKETYITTLFFGAGYSEHTLTTNNLTSEHSLIVRYDSGVVGSYTLELYSN